MPRLLAVGGGTKPRLSAGGAPRVSMERLTGILEYDPSEFTFTALAGTPMREIVAALAERGQYLPFDPFLLGAGSTLGGTVAAGLSGPGRFRYGGVRDFILGVRFVDGMGRLLRMGGKVVKNAAGFDLPKFFAGSLGRFGVLVECTFKVFPRPAATRTLKLRFEEAGEILTGVANSRWEAEAIDVLPDRQGVLVRLAAPEAALEAMAGEILARWQGSILSMAEAEAAWDGLREFQWAPRGGVLVKAPLTPDQVAGLYRDHPEALIHVSGGGNVAYVAYTPECRPALNGLTIRGATGPLWHGTVKQRQIAQAVKDALDPLHRFPSLDD